MSFQKRRKKVSGNTKLLSKIIRKANRIKQKTLG